MTVHTKSLSLIFLALKKQTKKPYVADGLFFLCPVYLSWDFRSAFNNGKTLNNSDLNKEFLSHEKFNIRNPGLERVALLHKTQRPGFLPNYFSAIPRKYLYLYSLSSTHVPDRR